MLPTVHSLAAVLVIAVSLTSFPLTGCTSTATKTTQTANGKPASMTQLRDDLRATRSALDRTLAALNRIHSSPNASGDYATYSKELGGLNKRVESSRTNSDNVREAGSNFFTYWEQKTQAIQVPEVREIADQRRTSIQAAFNALAKPMEEARTQLTELTTLLNDLSRTLALDLTASGIYAVQKQSEKATRQATELGVNLDDLASQFDRIASAMPNASK